MFPHWRTFSLSYSANLPSSLEVIHSLTLAYSASQSVSSFVSSSLRHFSCPDFVLHRLFSLCSTVSRHSAQLLIVDPAQNNLETIYQSTDSNRTLKTYGFQ